jgi:hypothetical protein
MTQQELRQKVFELTKTLIAKSAYIKGYGTGLYRACDKSHNPIINFNQQTMNVLKLNKVVKPDGLIYILAVAASPFTIPLDVQLPSRD